jgi:CubicO group peptidase (beta-lactamase class C family)
MKSQVLALWLLVSSFAAGQDKILEQKVDAYLEPFVQGKNFIGAVLIAKGDKVLVSKGYGEANYVFHVANTPETRFHIASVSKPFTSAGILLLEERGKLRHSASRKRRVRSSSCSRISR